MESALFSDPATLSLIVGLVLLGVDLLVIGLSPVMFVALAALATSAALYLSGQQPSLLATAAIVASLSVVLAVVGKRPLERFQASGVRDDQSSDLIGRELTTTHEVTKQAGVVYWSGVDWQARLASDASVDALAPGVRARVLRVDNLTLVLAPA